MPRTRTSCAGGGRTYTLPRWHAGHAALSCKASWDTLTLSAPVYADAGLRPCPLRFGSVVLASASGALALASGVVSGKGVPSAPGTEGEAPSCCEALAASVLEGASAVD